MSLPDTTFCKHDCVSHDWQGRLMIKPKWFGFRGNRPRKQAWFERTCPEAKLPRTLCAVTFCAAWISWSFELQMTIWALGPRCAVSTDRISADSSAAAQWAAVCVLPAVLLEPGQCSTLLLPLSVSTSDPTGSDQTTSLCFCRQKWKKKKKSYRI